MELRVYVPNSHWQDRAPSIELRRIENIRKLFKIGQVEKPTLTAYVEAKDLQVLSSPAQHIENIEDALYSVKGRIVAGYEAKIVVDCGVLLMIGLKDTPLNSPLKLRFGDYVTFNTRIFGTYHDDWEGLIRYEIPFSGKISAVDVVKNSEDISLLFDVIEGGRGITIHPPYKTPQKPDRKWSYALGK